MKDRLALICAAGLRQCPLWVSPGTIVISCVFLLSVFACITPSHAQVTSTSSSAPSYKTAILTDQTSELRLSEYGMILADPNNWLDLEKIVRQDTWRNLNITPNTAQSVPVPARNAHQWIVFPVRNNAHKTKWYVDIGTLSDGRTGIVRSATLYIHTANPYTLDTPGGQTPSFKLPTPQDITTESLVPITLPSGQNAMIILKLDTVSSFPAFLPLTIIDDKHVVSHISAHYEIMSIIFACLIGMVLFFLSFATAYKTQGWLPFSFYFLSFVIYAGLQNNLTHANADLIQYGLSGVFVLWGLLCIVMTRFVVQSSPVVGKDNIFYIALFLIAILGGITNLLITPEHAFAHMGLIMGPALLIFMMASLYSILRYESGHLYRLSLGIGWLFAFSGGLFSLWWMGDMISADSPLKNGIWFCLVPQGLFFMLTALQKNAGRVTTTHTEGASANLNIDALVKLRATKESAEQARLLRVIERERELLTQFRQREAQRSEEMRQAKEMADTANKAKSAFLAVVSHEIRTPMTGIMGMVRLLLDSKISREQKDYVTTIQESGDSMLTLLNDILDFEKIEQGKMVLEKISFDLPRLVNSIATLMSGHAAIKNITLRTLIDPDVPQYVMGDPSRLRQVLLNLTGNGIKFTSQGEVVIKVHLGTPDPDKEVSRWDQPAYDIYFAVKDSGIGISAEAQENIFTPFSQADSSISRKFGGTGLGLAICKGLIEAMGGKIHISSREGEGSMFFFTLNMPEGEADSKALQFSHTASGTSSLPAPPPRRSRRSYHLLVVDDNSVNQKVITSFLTRINHTADCVDTAENALALVQKKPYDLILMDIQLPGMSGDEATRILRKLPDPAIAQLPVIALTGNLRDEDRMTYHKAGMNGFVAKPIDPDVLESVIDEVMQDNAGTPASTDMSGWEMASPPNTPPDPAVTTSPSGHDDIFDDSMFDALKVNLGKEKLNELLIELMDKAHELVDALETSALAQDIQAMAARAHELKGMTGNFGLKELSQIAGDIEKMARPASQNTPDTAQIQTLIDELIIATSRADAVLKDWMANA
ncbi:MAG: response regulator [Alphaproteobacteria bacterium]|nr:response regulator [Alphaproteobacteria bacterium]